MTIKRVRVLNVPKGLGRTALEVRFEMITGKVVICLEEGHQPVLEILDGTAYDLEQLRGNGWELEKLGEMLPVVPSGSPPGQY